MNSFFVFVSAFILLILLGNSSCSDGHKETVTETKDFLFQRKSSDRTGISFSNTLTATTQLNILNYIYYYNGAGVATADFNNDGLLDLYFVANQADDHLYLNKGNFKFEEVSRKAGIENSENWTTGVTTVDINNDGLLDIYICKIGNFNTIQGHNLLFVNEGIDESGIPQFSEKAAEYNLDFKGFSTQAAFFDYDLDGDLDCFLLNHSTNPNQNYGQGSLRHNNDEESGDKLLENDSGTFKNVSEKAGIFQSKIGYGLGVSVSDLNKNGYPDIYVSNDFYENDYYYVNQGNKTFKEVISSEKNAMGHTTHFSMGNDIADLNNDGHPDIISLDMMPEDLETYKTSGTEFNYQIYNNYIKNGYGHQYMQNALQLNNGNGSFSETGYLSGIAATEWSWSPLLADFDNDGLNDIYVTNGILGATNDMDFINFIANDNIQKTLGNRMTEKEMMFIEKIPEKKTANYFFQNKGDNSFINKKNDWVEEAPSFSNGAVYADLDNDGDLDVVVNNVNEKAFVFENTLNSKTHLTIKLKGGENNFFGIGAKVLVYSKALKMLKENFPTRGYLSAVAPQLHFGLNNNQKADSVTVIWPDATFETFYNVPANKTLVANKVNARENYYEIFSEEFPQSITKAEIKIDYVHTDNPTIEFNRDPLIPFAMTNEGPDVSVADMNNDGRDDLFVSGAKGKPSALFVQVENGFQSVQTQLFEKDAINEDVSHAFFDANGNGFQDLIVVSGGNEFKTGKALSPRFYRNENGKLYKDSLQFKDIHINASAVSAVDIDNDGALDVCITSSVKPHEYGKSPSQYIFKNDGNGNFKNVTDTFALQLNLLGNITSVVWKDLDNNGFKDAIAVGDWMPVSVFFNDGKKLQLAKQNGLEKTAGFWNTIKAEDFDNDGDLDLVAGNWGLNSRLTASVKKPITLYRKDFDDNGKVEPVVTYYYNGKETTLSSKDELVKQMPFINKKYLSYSDFAKASIDDIFTKEKLSSAYKKQVFELATCYFENLGNNNFKKHKLPFKAQISSVNDILVKDFNNDGNLDLLLVGNNFEISTQLGRLDASHGILLLNDGKGSFAEAINQKFDIPGAARKISEIHIKGKNYIVVTRNNDTLLFYETN